jgi:mono/diheme cytochrome c family protein
VNDCRDLIHSLARGGRALALLSLSGSFALACSSGEAYKDKLLGSVIEVDADVDPAADAGFPDTRTDASDTQGPCIPAVASDPLPARDAVMADDLARVGSDQGVFTKALFDEFKRHCGDCHAGTAAHGGFSVDLSTFPNRVDAAALARVRSDVSGGANGFMPPAPQGVPFSTRAASDPLRGFANRLEQWLAQGSPADVFYPDLDTSVGGVGVSNPYLLRRDVAMQMTNLGNCVPAARLMATQREEAEQLDAKFAAMERFEDLPKSLRDTDLFTLDAEELATYGVVAFAPAYTLWADDAKKIRMLRVPRGQSIVFDKVTQSFDIPKNTRFYKTFLKRTVDLNGNERYRKLETRLIVARPEPSVNGSYQQTAIFGSYKWNEAETEATLIDTPYRDGKGFVDSLFPYVVDERLDDEVLRTGPKNQLAARLEAGSMRNYAIPGFDRCVHCHMGSPMQNFVLGFIPLQIHRRPLGEGGVVEPAERDELNQLQRLIDYGVITGMTSPEDIVPLEQSQGEREPRNEHELNAQGYMLGNCAHCHNPNGFPSLKEASLKDALNFLPSEDGGGIFQFPLEKYSPRTFRGVKQDIPVPYITPSLYDLYFEDLGLDNWGSFPIKWILDEAWIHEQPENLPDYWKENRFPPGRPLLAPWRSLIYRNVDTPFSYEEVGTIFPHMPMDTPGYDCRARQLLGSWMVSIPARWKLRGKEVPTRGSQTKVVSDGSDEAFYDRDPQPYTEVPPDDPQYGREVRVAESRAKRFREVERYNDCPDSALDVLDPVVAISGTGLPATQSTELFSEEGDKIGSYSLQSPARSHYFETDLRSNTSWIIRRGDWYEILVEGQDDSYVKGDAARKAWQRVREALQDVRVSPALRELALTELPFGLWVNKEACSSKFDQTGVPRASSFEGASRTSWMQYAPDLTPESPVYTTSPGAQVFEMICSKCHGPDGDGQSSLASTMADLTGGLTRVANLRDGIFGPLADPGANRGDTIIGFGKADGKVDRVTADDWAARYTVWMGLGGTRANIPKTVVASVGRSEILGQRSGIELDFVNASAADAANMLEIAKLSCRALMPNRPNPLPDTVADQDILFDPARGQLVKDPELDGRTPARAYNVSAAGRQQSYYSLAKTGLLTTNGHADLWERICLFENPLPVRLVSFESNGEKDFFYVSGLYRREAFRVEDGAVGDDTGHIATSLQPDNRAPWCVVAPTDPELIVVFEQYIERTGLQLPMCSDVVASPDAPGRIRQGLNANSGDDDVERWSIRGAMNAGVSVFVYLDARAKGEVVRKSAYNRCEELGP